MPIEKNFQNLLRANLQLFYHDSYIIYPKNGHSTNAHAHNVNVQHARVSKIKRSHSRHVDSQAKITQMPKNRVKNALNGPLLSFHTFDASYVLTNKSSKIVVKYVGPRHKSSNTCVWVQKVLVTNVKGPKTFGVHKNKA
jgi:hypothetical protein